MPMGRERSLIVHALLLLVAWVSACSSNVSATLESGAAETSSTTAPGSRRPTVLINEVGVETASSRLSAVTWVEIVNPTDYTVTIDDVSLEIGAVAVRIARLSVPPREFHRIDTHEFTASEAYQTSMPEVQHVRLYDRSMGMLDSMVVPWMAASGSIGRFPDAGDQLASYDADLASPGRANADPGIVWKLAAHTSFTPRDSSPNASVTFDGSFWVLSGWSNSESNEWRSYSDVWRSEDSVVWSLVSDAPPYNPYSSFLVWRNQLWAIGPRSYRTSDGLDWVPAAVSAPELNRTVVFNGRLVSIFGASVLESDDGEAWRPLTTSAPWGNERRQPGVVVFRGQLWVIGGFAGWNTPDERMYNDVWSSEDGRTWQLRASASPWSPRIWSSVFVYDSKIFVVNGFSRDEWSTEFGNTNEIWMTDDGLSWVKVPSERRWESRHASLTVVEDSRGVTLSAGYGHGGPARLYNDVWRLRASFYFPKPSGRLSSLQTWGRNLDGSGQPPASFSAPNQVFVLRNRPEFIADGSWAIGGPRSRLLVGDGSNPVVLRLMDQRGAGPMYLNSASSTFVGTGVADVRYRDETARLIPAR